MLLLLASRFFHVFLTCMLPLATSLYFRRFYACVTCRLPSLATLLQSRHLAISSFALLLATLISSHSLRFPPFSSYSIFSSLHAPVVCDSLPCPSYSYAPITLLAPATLCVLVTHIVLSFYAFLLYSRHFLYAPIISSVLVISMLLLLYAFPSFSRQAPNTPLVLVTSMLLLLYVFPPCSRHPPVVPFLLVTSVLSSVYVFLSCARHPVCARQSICTCHLYALATITLCVPAVFPPCFPCAPGTLRAPSVIVTLCALVTYMLSSLMCSRHLSRTCMLLPLYMFSLPTCSRYSTYSRYSTCRAALCVVLATYVLSLLVCPRHSYAPVTYPSHVYSRQLYASVTRVFLTRDFLSCPRDPICSRHSLLLLILLPLSPLYNPLSSPF